MIGFTSNWWRHQHYRDRHPPWIKLHRSVLTNPAIQSLSEIDQWRLVKLWLHAAETEGAYIMPNLPPIC